MTAPIVAVTIVSMLMPLTKSRPPGDHEAEQEATDEAADDPEHDVPDDPHALVTLDEQAGEPAGNRADDQP